MVNSDALVPLMATFGLPDKFKEADPVFSMVKVLADGLVPDT